MKKKYFIIVSLFFISSSIFAQSFEQIFIASNDASTYAQNFLKPGFKGLLFNMSNGWYNTAKTHKKLGFDITINATASFVPTNDKHFTFNQSDYQYLTLESGSNQLPTVMGNISNSQLSLRIPIQGNQFKTANFNAIKGVEKELPFSTSVVPTPMVQIGIGLPSKTDLKIRYIPSVGKNGTDFSLIGIGLQHDILQYIPVAKHIPLFNLAVLAAFTHATLNYKPTNSLIAGQNQETEVKLNSYTFQAISSINLKIVNFYLGAGYTTGNSNLKVKGTYQYNYIIKDNNGNTVNTTTETIKDPIKTTYNVSGVKATLGMRFNIFFFKIFADYTIQEYNALNAGIAFSFR